MRIKEKGAGEKRDFRLRDEWAVDGEYTALSRTFRVGTDLALVLVDDPFHDKEAEAGGIDVHFEGKGVPTESLV